ncbi:alpha/beta hydrolase [Mucilaginibacter pedocola]|uniref:AB hydrolase-1 domain-containing protein n=1 Tax=Mucilaginibacter pedocola TaxID=1792845 RepID=A0A1S9P6T7_9SPHI|nr:alpha/beta hydrolase [Mucilaginibacter pedocola]OOQ56659.1 hypothetical protein BC343_19745 [Mucilaginibacter pedocola]
MMNGEWIRKPKGKTTVVFIHGLFSDGGSCWLNENGTFWPKLLTEDPDLKGLGVFVFTYQTGLFSRNYSLSDIVDALKEYVVNLEGLTEGKDIIFVCHSMGGIIARKFIVERSNDLISGKTNVGLFLVASPSLGSGYASLFKPVAKLFGNIQVDTLRFEQNNSWLNDLDKTFQNLKSAGKLPIYGKELIEDKFVFGGSVISKQVVEPFSGARYFGESFKVPGSDHFTIAKPIGKDDIQHRLLLKFIEDFIASTASTQDLKAEFGQSGHKRVTIKTAARKKLKYYIYISEAKVTMILAQMNDSEKGEYAVSAGVEVNKGSSIEELPLEKRLLIVLEYLNEEGSVGTLSEPRKYFKGQMGLRWGVSVDNFTLPNQIVYFTDFNNNLLVGLGGSSRHLVTNLGYDFSPDLNSTTFGILRWLGKELDKDVRGEFYPNYMRDERSYYRSDLYAMHSLARSSLGPVQELEFVAKRLLATSIKNDDGEDVTYLLGTPLYVAMAD